MALQKNDSPDEGVKFVQADLSRGPYERGSAPLVALCSKNWKSLAIGAAGGVLLGVLYLYVATPQYKSYSAIMIDTRRVQSAQQQLYNGETPTDSGAIESEVEVLRSSNLLRTIVDKLELASDPEFIDERTEPNSDLRKEAALQNLRDQISVRRAGLSFVIEVGVTSSSREKASRIANAITQTYINGQIESRNSAAERVRKWLEVRVEGARADAQLADRLVQEFKATRRLFDADGRADIEQQYSEANRQLVSARATTQEAQARYDRIRAIVQSGTVPESTVPDILTNEVVIKLRQQYLDASRRAAEISAKTGSEHPAVINLRGEMLELQRNIADELQHVARAYESNLSIAGARQKALEDSLNSMRESLVKLNLARVSLRDLESRAQAARDIYNNLRQRQLEALQQESFPAVEARIISTAMPPLLASSPRVHLALLFSIMLGLLLGGVVAGIRNYFGRTRPPEQALADALQDPVTPAFPFLQSSRQKAALIE